MKALLIVSALVALCLCAGVMAQQQQDSSDPWGNTNTCIQDADNSCAPPSESQPEAPLEDNRMLPVEELKAVNNQVECVPHAYGSEDDNSNCFRGIPVDELPEESPANATTVSCQCTDNQDGSHPCICKNANGASATAVKAQEAAQNPEQQQQQQQQQQQHEQPQGQQQEHEQPQGQQQEHQEQQHDQQHGDVPQPHVTMDEREQEREKELEKEHELEQHESEHEHEHEHDEHDEHDEHSEDEEEEEEEAEAEEEAEHEEKEHGIHTVVRNTNNMGVDMTDDFFF